MKLWWHSKKTPDDSLTTKIILFYNLSPLNVSSALTFPENGRRVIDDHP